MARRNKVVVVAVSLQFSFFSSSSLACFLNINGQEPSYSLQRFRFFPLFDSGSELERNQVCVLLSEEDRSCDKEASKLASKLSLPLVEAENVCSETYTHVLTVSPYAYGSALHSYSVGIQGLAVRAVNTATQRRKRAPKQKLMNPFFVDFLPASSSTLGKRFQEGGSDLLIKAVSPRKGFDNGATICDLTAGLGQDSLLIAKAGAQHVRMVERNPIVCCLLQDALRRLGMLASAGIPEATDLFSKLSLTLGDGLELAQKYYSGSEPSLVDIFYLDPMFPVRRKAASVKKNMQVLHSLLQSQQEGDVEERQSEEADLLEAAYKAAQHKVVVKRPRSAPALGEQISALRPSFSVSGSTNRFDIYVK